MLNTESDRRYDAYRLTTSLFARVHDDTALEIIASELDYDPCQLQEDIIALKQVVEGVL